MKLTPEGCAAMYDALRAHQPFSRWDLPKAVEVEFYVTRDKAVFGTYCYDQAHAITVSEVVVGHWSTLSETVAHEMIHLHQSLRKKQTRAEHNREFRKLALEVCQTFGFDPRCF